MQPEALLMWIATFAVVCYALLRSLRGLVFAPIAAPPEPEGDPQMPDEDDQQPETDRAPVRQRQFPTLQLTVAATAAVRIGFFVALHR